MSRQSDPLLKALARRGYRAALGAASIADMALPRRDGVAVYYGGARAGDIGGPLVKVKRLKQYFPEQRWGYTLVYVLSNAPYLPEAALRRLKRRRIPIVHNQNGVFYPAWYDGDFEAENARMAVPYHLADYVFWQSAFCKRSADRFLGERSGPGEILFNGIDTGHFRPATDRDPARPFTFLITGKLGGHLDYRVTGTIEALALVRRGGLEARLAIAGWVEDGLKARAAALAQRLGIAGAVVFSGPYTQEQAPDIYRAADAYVMTKHNDPCPNTVLEALASGLPVAYSSSGGVPELVGAKAGAGIAAPEIYDKVWAPDAVNIAAAMAEVAAKRETMAAAARQRAVESFDITHWIGRHEAVFTRLVEEVR
ncbi:MAG: glycosyltransferase family 4 protein [Hyphomicrobiales bacterium]|nr:glycosyltransferase family 4 protein [Hyphomicrobiales bacterium]